MIKKIKTFLNKPKVKRIIKKEAIQNNLPEKSFSKKFYTASKDLRKETVLIKLPGGKILAHKQGFKQKVEIPIDILHTLKAKGVNVSKCQIIHNHTISKNAISSLKPSIGDIKASFQLYKQFGITNHTILFIDKKTMQEFGRCFYKFDSSIIKNKIKNFNSHDNFNIWFNGQLLHFGRVIDSFTLEDLNNLGFKLRFQGLNGNKYNSKTEKFEKI